jgi:MFS superfamily sulfate permease-like transporter
MASGRGSLLALRADWKDAREGRPAFLGAFITDPVERRRLFRSALQDVGRVFVVAVVLDTAYQLMVFRWVYLRIDESLYFPNARYIEDRINEAVAASPTLRHVILECPAVNTIDTSALESLEAINHRLKDGGITLHLSEVKGPVMDRLKRSHFLDELTGKVHLSHSVLGGLRRQLSRTKRKARHD